MKMQMSEAPVPIQVHHEVVRWVEQAVMTELSKFEHAWMPVGTRVTYSLADEDGQPVGGEYKLECGYLDPLDQAPTVEVSEDEWEAMLAEECDTDVLTIDFVDELHRTVQERLESSANRPLVVGVAGVLTGSISCWGAGCWCPGRKGYYRRCRLVCTTTSC